MAVGADLSRPGPRRRVALVAVVLLVHVVALQWASRLYAQASLLKPMQPTMYTRLLEPKEPAPVVAVASPAPAARPVRPQARLEQPKPQPVAPQPEPAASSAAQAERAVAEQPVPAASQPQPAASVAVAAASAAPPATPAASAPAPVAASAASAAVAQPAAAASAPSAIADSWPADTRLRYKLGGRFRSGELHGDARVLWQRVGTRYQVRVELNIPLMASVSMTSQGEVGAMLAPQVYEEARNGKPRGLRVGENAITLANGNTVPRPPGVQDTASQFVELSQRFATGREKLEVGRTVSFWMARPGGVERWTYDVAQSELLYTPMGPVEAFHLKPRPIANARGNIYAEMWFAPSLQHLPVRIKVSMGEEAVVDLMVEAIEQR